MKNLTRSFLFISFLAAILVLTGCKKTKMATLTTSAVSDLTLVSAKSGGNISDDGNADITARGVCWSTLQTPTTADNITTDGIGAGAFESQLTGLTEGTTYYVRAYATNSEGTSYGNEESFTSVAAGMASVTTKAISDVTFTTAKSGGDIATDGGAVITAKGICWNTAANPTITNNKTTDGTGNNGFVSNITGLTQGTIYYVRAYATNKAGTSYGNQVTFTTLIVKAPELRTSVLSTVTLNSAVSGGTISNDGGAPVTARGIVWGIVTGPTTANHVVTTGTGTGIFVSNITGLTPGSIYFVRAYATNSAGTSYGNEIKFSTSISDIENNVYRTVPIGNQLWMAENLKTTRYKNNTPIVFMPDSLTWMHDTIGVPAYSIYRNNILNKTKYGLIYNWYTIPTGNLCPDGWHVPTHVEFKTMEVVAGIPADSIDTWGWRGNGVGTKLKDSIGWLTGNGNNSTGFKAVPAGYRAWNNAQYRALGEITYLWTATDDAINHKPTVAWYRRLDGADNRVYNATTVKTGGKSIRCVKNQ